jgi:hypothetical protein
MGRKSISLQDKQNIIREVDNGTPYSQIVQKYGLKNVANISMIVKRREQYINIEQSYLTQRKTLKTAKYENIDKKLLEYISDCYRSGICVDTSMMRQKAMDIAHVTHQNDFKSSFGYIERFKSRNKAFFDRMVADAVKHEADSTIENSTNCQANAQVANEQAEVSIENHQIYDNDSLAQHDHEYHDDYTKSSTQVTENNVDTVDTMQVLAYIELLKLYSFQKSDKNKSFRLLNLISQLEAEILSDNEYKSPF